MSVMGILENVALALTARHRIDGPLKLDGRLFKLFLSLPEDPLPDFQSATPQVRGRGNDHPRYGRWMHAFVKFHKPDIVVEVGTNAGGTAVGAARALVENLRGRLLCVDNGKGLPRSFPEVARANIRLTGLPDERFELICDDSENALPGLSSRLAGKVDIYLVDASHTFEAALADIESGLPMMKRGGFILVHDVDTKLILGTEASKDHPCPVFEAFQKVARERGFEWCVLKFIRKHLGVMKVR